MEASIPNYLCPIMFTNCLQMVILSATTILYISFLTLLGHIPFKHKFEKELNKNH